MFSFRYRELAAASIVVAAAIGWPQSSYGQESELDDTVPTQLDGAGGSTSTIDTVRVVGCNDPACFEKPMETTGLGFSSGSSRFGGERRLNEGVRGDPSTEEPNPKNANDKKVPKCGNPIIVSTGNKIEPELDFITPGEAALQFRRTWNQHGNEVGLFGYFWISSFDYRLSFTTSSPFGPSGTCYARPSVAQCSNTGTHTTLWSHRPDGRKIKYVKGADGVYYEDKASPVAKIVRQADGRWILYSEVNDVEIYTASGLPISIKNSHGVGWTFTHGGMNGSQLQRVTHTSGRYVDLVWVGDELREVKDPAGNAYTYTYSHQKIADGFHLLKTTTLPGSPQTVITYHYEGEAGEPDYAAYALTGKSFNGVRYSWFTYDTSRRATTTQHTDGADKYSYVYTPGADGTMSVAETNPFGKKATYYFNADGLLTEMLGQASANCPAASKGATYDTNGYPDVVSDFNDNVIDYDYNAKGQLLKQVEAYGKPEARTTTYVWDAAKNRITGFTIAGLSKTDYTYTADNRPLSIKVTNLKSTGVLNQVRITTFSYSEHSNGLLLSTKMDGPLPGTTDEVESTFDAFGNLTSVKNSLGHTTSYSGYNALGLPGRVAGPNSAVVDYVYDARGRVTSEKRSVNGAWQTTTYKYNAAGLLESVTRPDGQVRNYVYDAARRLVREYEAESATTFAQKRYTYNNASLVTRVDTERTTTPLSAPSISAPGTSSNGTYSVSWTSIADTTSYRLIESVNGGAWALIQNTSATSRPISGKGSGTYSYRVTACNAAGCGPTSSAVNVVVTLSGPPATPSLTAPPGYSFDGSYSAAWGAVPGATYYRLEEQRNTNGWIEVYNGTGTSTAFTKTSTAEFSYQVRACNSTGCSAYSTTRTILVEINSCPSCLVAPPNEPIEGSVLEGYGQ